MKHSAGKVKAYLIMPVNFCQQILWQFFSNQLVYQLSMKHSASKVKARLIMPVNFLHTDSLAVFPLSTSLSAIYET
jgi:hypothetical protein